MMEHMSKEMPEMTEEEHKHMQMSENGDKHHHDKPVEDSELASWKRKLIWAWILTIPIAILMIVSRFGIELLPEAWMTIVILILAFPVIFILGFSTLKSGIRGIISFYFNMDSLIALGTLISYLTGIISFFGIVQDYSGVSSMIMAFFITGRYVETLARGRASQEIRKLLELGAKKARILTKSGEIEVNIEELKVGDIMIVKPGEKIPTDGIVVRGASSVDESMVSGESIPKDKKKNDLVIGATINQDGILYIKATKIGKDTFLSHIINLIEEAQGTKIPIQKLADKITSIFVPAIIVLSFLTFLDWWYITSDVSRAIGVAVSVLVIACPCALGLATPTALMVSSGMGAKKGILIRKGEAIQTLKKIKMIVFDKTGTITKGKPEVSSIFSLVKENYLLEIAASVENLSEHPLAKAIVDRAGLKRYRQVTGFRIIRGKGVEGRINNKEIVIGNGLLMKEKNISIDKIRNQISDFENSGKTCMIVAENKKVLGVIGVADKVKPEAKEVISLLNLTHETWMITGDNETTARAIAREVGIKNIMANVLPEDKENKIIELQKKGFVAFVGDGINDAPAIKQSNVGIVMGTGTDIAIESGDIILSSGNLKGVVSAINLSKATFRKIKQNLFWAFGYNILAIPIAVLGFLNPVIAEIAMALSSITVVGNANLLRNEKI